MNKNINAAGHPGPYVKEHVIPTGLSVKDAAKQLGVGRPALSNFLNGKAALSLEMATRLEKAFGADRQDLLDKQTAYNGDKQLGGEQPAVVTGYIPPIMQITARQIEEWGSGNITARNELADLLRRLANSTSTDILAIDFPAFDNAERPGWDGMIDALKPTPWVPAGKSGWEFGCNKKPQVKASNDYVARTESEREEDRAETTFVFVTPRNWKGKKTWVEERRKEGQWKDVRAYDASDLEQWLEASAPGQIWLAERLNLPVDGFRALSQCWEDWRMAGEPYLSTTLFTPAIKNFSNTFLNWLKSEPNRPFVISADSRGEGLAFLYCMMASSEITGTRGGDQVIVFEKSDALNKLASSSDGAFVAVASTPEVERALVKFFHRFHCIIIRPKNLVESEPDIVLDLLNSTDFQTALKDMGIDEDMAQRLEQESGRSPTILRRRLSKVDEIKKPDWAKDQGTAADLAAVALAGAWNADKDADQQIVSLISGIEYGIVEQKIARIRIMEDAPLWSIGKYRGVASKIDALFAIAPVITEQQLKDFFIAAEYVLSEYDPALELPADKRSFSALYGKVRDHSAILRRGICETLVLLAVSGNALFSERLGIDIDNRVSALIRGLLTPLSANGLHSNNYDLPRYAEAAPEVFLDLVESDLDSDDPVVFQLLKPADSSLFGGGCPRTGLLWALECLAWKPDYLLRVSKILAILATRQIDDNWTNKPEQTLKSIFRSWMPQTAASIEQRIKVLEFLVKNQSEVAWRLCIEQFETGSRTGDYNYRPRWRGDASGAGHPVSRDDHFQFVRKSIDICLNWSKYEVKKLGDLIERLQMMSDEDQKSVWSIIDNWAASGPPEEEKAVLRECIRRYAFTRLSRRKNISKENAEKARSVSMLLAPHDPVVRYKWLFEKQWVEESYDEMENDNFDYETREKRIIAERTEALKTIWQAKNFNGLIELLETSGAERIVGSLMLDILRRKSQRTAFIRSCLNEADEDNRPALQECLWGFLNALDKKYFSEVIAEIGEGLSRDQICMLFLAMPFRGATWRLLAQQPQHVHSDYWKNVNPYWRDFSAHEIAEIIEQLLKINRPVAAFKAVHLTWKTVETKQLTDLLRAVAVTPKEKPEIYRISEYEISEAFDELDKRNDVTIDEKANLEFMYLDVLEHSKHGIPNLEYQISVSPKLFVQAICLTFKRQGEGEDPKEWQFDDPDINERIAKGTYKLLDCLRRTPGMDKNGRIKINDLKEWLSHVREKASQHGRADIADQMIGQLLSRSVSDEEGNWPSRPVCEALEWMSSEHVELGFHIGTRNSRGVHWRGEGGDQERELADKYHSLAQRINFEFPYVAKILDGVAESYDREAQWQDTDAKIRSRIAY